MKVPGLDLEVGTIYCIGRNYAEHAKELGNEVPKSPLVFLKPRTSLTTHGKIRLPIFSQNVHHEVEIVVAVGKASEGTEAARAMDLVAGYAIGIDVTARDVQDDLKKKGAPWTLAKGLPTFAPVSHFVPKLSLPASFSLSVNGAIRQSGNTSQMLFSIPALIEYLSKTYHLLPGDLIFTGTPPGVGPIRTGDRLCASLADAAKLEIDAE